MKKLKNFLLILFVFMTHLLLAQPGGGNPEPASAPIDGGILGLLAAGTALGVKYLRKQEDNSN